MMKTVRRLFALALVLVCLGAVYILPASAMTRIPEVDIDNEEDYNAYLEEGDGEIPDYFVTAEELRPFGSFQSMTSDFNYVISYQYDLTAQNGERIRISIRNRAVSKSGISAKGTLDPDLVGADMRTLTEEVYGSIVRQGVQYQYYEGKLDSISWMTEDYRFWLSFPEGQTQYPALPEDALLSRLVSVSEEDFASARQELAQICQAELTVGKTFLQTILTYDLPWILLIGAGVGLWIIIRRKKKKYKYVPAG